MPNNDYALLTKVSGGTIILYASICTNVFQQIPAIGF